VPLLSLKSHQPLLTPEIEALQKAQPVLASVPRLVKKYEEWAEVLLQLGLNNLVSFPLVVRQRIYGLLNLYSSIPRSYSDDEFSLLGEVADLIAFRIHAYQEEIRKKRLEEELAIHSRKLRKTMEMTIQALAVTIEMRDPYTAGHQRRVTQLASRMAQEMNLEEDQILNIRLAGIIHDIGKIYVPVEILTKPGRLNDYEISMIKSHPRFGFDIIKETDLPKKIGEIILQHHERMDGSGYPYGLVGEEIHLESRILSVADVVEAMSSHRPYRPALGLEAALEEIDQHKGFLFDPDVVDVCLDLFEEKRFCWTREESVSTITH
jgi:putative nucleotidyltransferase with HDIG domain